ncbi:MAG: UDP-N-acetylglucosamine 4,6-dehydratase family protein [Bacteroidales bacterium]|jgi:FlaA1/EpsC-like NDP-sugar epimerase
MNFIVKLFKKNINRWVVLFTDTVVSTITSIISLLIATNYFGYLEPKSLLIVALLSFVISFVSFLIFKTEQNSTRNLSVTPLLKITGAVIVKIILLGGLVFLFKIIPNKQLFFTLIIDAMLTLLVLLLERVIIASIYQSLVVQKNKSAQDQVLRKMLIFNTHSSSIAIKDILYTQNQFCICGFLESNVECNSKNKYKIDNFNVYCVNSQNDFIKLVEDLEIDGVVFSEIQDAINEKDSIIKYCEQRKIITYLTPPISEITGGNFLKANMKDIKIEDLLGRSEINVDEDRIKKFLDNKVVMVTGAAGSIGSELCRQVAAIAGCELVLYDIAESPLHDLQMELENRFPYVKFHPIVGDIRNKSRLNNIMKMYKPSVLFHAAAYKHVPLMEINPCEAIRTNVVGTSYVADIAAQNNIETMVMISTDKAVNPTSVMGASKRMAEIYVQSLGLAIEQGKVKGNTKFITTRFGNVLGSNGSVVPYFRKQIDQGGPVTVTHPEITRFFMTISEACNLVMEATTINLGSHIYVFDMGKPVKILDLAKRMIIGAGYRPGIDIEIKFIGLRPGEKLYEEVLNNKENTIEISYDKIKIAKVRSYDYFDVRKDVDDLFEYSKNLDVENTILALKKNIPEYKSNNSIYEKFDK